MANWLLFPGVLLVALCCASASDSGDSQCKAPIDLLFLVDKSASIKPQQFVIEKKFVREMIKKFEVGPTDVQVSVVLFAIHVHNQFCFDNFTTKEEVIQAVNGLRCPACKRGKTGTGEALQFGREVSLQAKCGARPDARKIVVVLTDGRSTEKPAYLRNQAQLMKDTGAQVITIGVGKIDIKELRLIASDQSLVFTAKRFDLLMSKLDEIATKTCDVAEKVPGYKEPCKDDCDSNLVCVEENGQSTCQCPAGQIYNRDEKKCVDAPPAQCDAEIDLLFLMDKSASIKDTDFKMEKEFVEKMIDHFEVSPTKVQVSLLLFAIGVHNQFCFDDYKKAEILQAVRDLECQACQAGKTGTGAALKFGREVSLTDKCGARPNAKKIVVVLTDGGSTEPAKFLKEQALLMKRTGAVVLSIGVGKKIKMTELELIATERSLVFTADNFDKLENILDDVTNTTCDVAVKDPIFDARLDVLFMVDGSVGVGENNFKLELNFVQRIISQLFLTAEHTMFSTLQFSDKVSNLFCFKGEQNDGEIKTALEQAKYDAGKKRLTSLAFKYAQSTSFTAQCGARPGVPKLIILITAGQAVKPPHAIHEAQKLVSQGVTVVSIGCGSGITLPQVQPYASSTDLAFHVDLFSQLTTIEITITAIIIEVANRPGYDEPCWKIEPCAFNLRCRKAGGTRRCLCKKGFEFDKDLSMCKRLRKVPGYQEPCKSKCRSNLECLVQESEKLCLCPDGFFWEDNTETCEKVPDFQEPCTTVCASNLECMMQGSQQLCVCRDGFVWDTAKETCEKYPGFQEPCLSTCASNLDCLDHGSEKLCLCIDGFYWDVNTLTCEKIPGFNESCSSDCASNMVCMMQGSERRCLCLDGYLWDVSREMCLEVPSFQEPCTSICASDLECLVQGSEKLCLCIDGFYWDAGNQTCEKVPSFQEPCTSICASNLECLVQGSEKLCLCVDGFYWDLNKQTCEKVPSFQESCTGKCASNLQCVAGICQCQSDEYFSVSQDRCLPIPGHNETCESTCQSNLVCKDGRCHCRENEEYIQADMACRPHPPPCKTKVDLLFVIDASGSLGKENFQKELHFVKKLLVGFTIGPDDVQVAAFTFSYKLNNLFCFNKYSNAADVISAVEGSVYDMGYTLTHLALSKAREMFKTPGCGARADAEKVTIVITDGKSTKPAQTKVQAMALKPVSLVVSVGIGKGIDRSELEIMASDPSKVFVAENFDSALDEIRNKVAESACKQPPKYSRTLYFDREWN